MSDFMKQEHTVCDFFNSDSWVILSPIEQSIKRKIEAVGIPLKDWDIRICRGILTGYNDAFIISTEKRDEILNNCQTEGERNRTAELIRPILRGRDVKRYEYDWADLWLINMHNGLKNKGINPIDINDYPAIKEWLDYGGVAYSGKIYNGFSQIEKRSDQGNTPYNLRNCAYMEDFSKPKIVYPNMTKYMPFVYDEGKFITNQKCFIIVGQSMAYLTAFLNSSIFKFCFRDSFPELQGGTRELSKIFFNKIPVLKVSDAENERFKVIVKKLQSDYTKEQAITIDNMLFHLYNLTEDEQKTIGYIEIS